MTRLQPLGPQPQRPLCAFSAPPGGPSCPAPVEDRVTLSGAAPAEAPVEVARPRHRWVQAALLAAVAVSGIAGAVAGLSAAPASAAPTMSQSVTIASVPSTRAASTVLPKTTVRIGDKLTVPARRGDTMWSYASRFARDANGNGRIDGNELRAYLADLKAANGGSSDLHAGRSVNLPVTKNSGQALTFTIAARNAYSSKYPKMDWLSAKFEGDGPLESFRMSFRDSSGHTNRLLVAPNLEDGHGNEYQVLDEPLIRKYFPGYH